MPVAITTNVSIHNRKIYLMVWHRPIVMTVTSFYTFYVLLRTNFDIDMPYFRRYGLSYN